jgi:NADPH:quinone reductase-like Zn-dependent oxidoreductase
MKAAILDSINNELKIAEIDKPILNEGESLVRLHAAALNHRDVWIQKGQYAGIRFPIILGSDGAGVLELAKGEYNNELLNKNVIINPSLNWGNNPRIQAKDYVILGTPDNGTFAKYVKVPSRLVYPMPPHLSFEQAAALPLAGLTAFRAIMKRAGAQVGDKVLVTGVGGGVALFCMQFAIAAGCEVFVTSGSDDKLQKAKSLGATGGVNYKQPDWDKQLKSIAGGFDVIIDSSGGDTFPKLVDLAKPAARIAMYGATLGEFKSGVAAKIFWKQLDILGSTMGNDEEFREMLAFINENKIIPVVDEVFSLEEVNKAMQKMESSSQFGKLVLKIN